MMIFLQMEDDLDFMFIMGINVMLLDYGDLCFIKSLLFVMIRFHRIYIERFVLILSREFSQWFMVCPPDSMIMIFV